MRKELDELLCRRYPFIFKDRNAPMNTTCMCWGFSCGNGWFWLIDNLCSSIQCHIDQQNSSMIMFGKNTDSYWSDKKEIPQVVAVQVKEKLSSMRFYYNGGDEHIRGMVSLAGSMSCIICEECGSTKDVGVTSGGWLTTLCKTCHKNKEEDRTGKSFSLEPRTNCYDHYAEIRALKEGDFCFDADNNKCVFLRHVSEYEKEIKIGNETKIIERCYLWIIEEQDLKGEHEDCL